MRLILASGSTARAALLKNAGLEFSVVPADVDEAAIKSKMLQQSADASSISASLALEKAVRVSRSNPDAIVIGADQVLLFDGRIFDKPANMAEARSHLLTLRGLTHSLVSAVSVVIAGQEMWTTSQTAFLSMRDFSEPFLDAYLEKFGADALTSVGAYHLEGLGSQLFSHIEGDYFTILGLPLLPLLEFLRSQDIVPT